MKLTRFGKNLFIGIEGVLFGLTMIFSFKYQILAFIMLGLITLNGSFLSKYGA